MSTRRLTNRKRRSHDLTFAWDPNDVAKLSRLQDAEAEARKVAERPRAKSADHAALADAEQALADFVAAIPTAQFHLVACGRKKAEKLVRKHPPSAEQRTQHREDQEALGVDKVTGLQYDPDEVFDDGVDEDLDDNELPDENGVVTYSGDDITSELFIEIFEDPAWSTVDQGMLFQVCDMLNQAGSAVNRDLVERLGNG